MISDEKNSRKIVYYIVLPAIFALYCIAKVFYLPHCFAFDANDEANHTFPNLFAAFHLLRGGYLPLMNLTNNFGTPLMGDCLTFPFSLFSWSYHLLPGPAASTLNRALIIFFTLAAATAYYRRYFAFQLASLCAFLLVLNPGTFWNMAHHHYQGAVLFTVLLLLFQERMQDSQNVSPKLLFFAAATAFVMSVSINLVVYGFVFVLLNALFLHKNSRSILVTSSALLAAAAIFYLPEFLMFKEQFLLSTRGAEVYGAPMPLREFFLSIVGGAKITFNQQYWHYVSWPLIWLTVLAFFLPKETFDTKARLRVVVLGLLPLILVLSALGNFRFYRALPFLSATDITRILWISMIFFIPAAGKALKGIGSGSLSGRVLAAAAGTCAAYILFIHFWAGWNLIPWQYSISVFIAFAAFCGLLLARQGPAKKILFAALLGAVLLTRLPVCYLILGQGHPAECRVMYSHWYSQDQQAAYPEPGVLQFVEPFSRISHEEETYWGRDLRLVYHDLFGVHARAPLVHAGMYDYLLREQLIDRPEWLVNYYLARPWRAEPLQELGVRYLIARETEESVQRLGWHLLARRGNVALMENPLATSVVYLERENERKPLSVKDAVVFRGNGFEVNLPQLDSKQELVAAFIDRPGWKVSVDDQMRAISHLSNQLMRVAVKPGDQKVRFDYQPFKWGDWMLCMAAALLLAAAAVFFPAAKKG